MNSGPKDSAIKHFQKAFGSVVREYRMRLNATQEEFAAKCGLHRTYISFIERGQKAASLRALYAVARALEMKPHILIKEAEQYA